MHENRETSEIPAAKPSRRTAGEGQGRTARMHVPEESDSGAVPMNHSNKDEKLSAESEEGRPLIKENILQPSTHSTRSEAPVSQGLAGVRKAARESKELKFTALLHHMTVDLLRESFRSLKRKAAPGVDGMTWLEYETGLEGRIAPAMQRDSAENAARRGMEDTVLQMQSDTEAYFGHCQNARSLSEGAAELARRRDKNEAAATYYANEALWDAEVGDFSRTIKAAQSALALAPSRDVETLVALAFARMGFVARAKALSAKLASANPANTILNIYWLPTIRAAIELDLNRPNEALAILQATAPRHASLRRLCIIRVA